jgi:hypothetical protein
MTGCRHPTPNVPASDECGMCGIHRAQRVSSFVVNWIAVPAAFFKEPSRAEPDFLKYVRVS